MLIGTIADRYVAEANNGIATTSKFHPSFDAARYTILPEDVPMSPTVSNSPLSRRSSLIQ